MLLQDAGGCDDGSATRCTCSRALSPVSDPTARSALRILEEGKIDSVYGQGALGIRREGRWCCIGYSIPARERLGYWFDFWFDSLGSFRIEEFLFWIQKVRFGPKTYLLTPKHHMWPPAAGC